jgi:PilZ domain
VERVSDSTHKSTPLRVARPRARRYPFVASIEITDLQSEVRLQERVTDLSLFGCGAPAHKTFPAGTKVRVRITHASKNFAALGRIAYATSGNMGIIFTRIERNDQTILEKWISELRDS